MASAKLPAGEHMVVYYEQVIVLVKLAGAYLATVVGLTRFDHATFHYRFHRLAIKISFTATAF